jgi:hypothetical protein
MCDKPDGAALPAAMEEWESGRWGERETKRR